MTQFISRAYNRLQLDEARGIITKVSKEDRLKDEINYYRALPQELALYFPHLRDAYSKGRRHFLSLEYYPYRDLGKLMVEGKFASHKKLWQKIFMRLKNIMNEMHSLNSKSSAKHFESMYIRKTRDEYEKLRDNFPAMGELCTAQTLTINGKRYRNFESLWPLLVPKIKKLYKSNFSAIHGDLCFNNILFGAGDSGAVGIKLIDPRGRFGAPGYWGDSRYDYAKILHSIDGAYEYIVHDKFTLLHTKNSISFSFKNDSRAALLKLFNTTFKDSAYFKKNRKEFGLICGLIFVGMCARHYDSIRRQKVMYATGVRMLNEYLAGH